MCENVLITLFGTCIDCLTSSTGIDDSPVNGFVSNIERIFIQIIETIRKCKEGVMVDVARV